MITKQQCESSYGIWVDGHRNKDGTYVKGYCRHRPQRKLSLKQEQALSRITDDMMIRQKQIEQEEIDNVRNGMDPLEAHRIKYDKYHKSALKMDDERNSAGIKYAGKHGDNMYSRDRIF